MKLADRPAANLRALIRDASIERGQTTKLGFAKALSAREVGVTVWPDTPTSTAAGRVEHVLAGCWSGPDRLEALAAYFGVDAGVFYQEPVQ